MSTETPTRPTGPGRVGTRGSRWWTLATVGVTTAILTLTCWSCGFLDLITGLLSATR